MKKSGISNIEQYVIDKVKEKRIKFNFTQVDLAVELGVSPGFIGNIESRKFRAKYNLDNLNQLAKIFKCSPRDFLPKESL